MEKPRVVIQKESESKARVSKCLEEFQEIFSNLSTEVPLIIIVDMFVPEGTPITVNPNTLFALIRELQQRGCTNLSVFAASMWGFDTEKIWDFFGYQELLIELKVGILHELPATQPNIIFLSQVKTSPVWGLNTCIRMVPLLYSAQERWKETSGNLLAEQSKFISRMISEFKPILFLNDLGLLLQGNGPISSKNAHSLQTDILVASDNLIAGDFTVFQLLNYDPINHSLFQTILKENFQDFSPQNIDIIHPEHLSSKLAIKKAFENPQDYQIPQLNLYIGEISQSLKYSLLLFLNRIDELLTKDYTNLESWCILAGKTPPEPREEEFIILFGDDAILTTKDYKFRTIVKKSDFLEGDELERLILKEQSKIRQKIEDARNESALKISLIKKKTNALDQELSTLEEEAKLEQKLAKMEHNIVKIRIDLKAKHETIKFQNQMPKKTLNENVVEISGNPPKGWDGFIPIINLWDFYRIPMINIFVDTTKRFYLYPEYDAKAMKKAIKTLKTELKSNLEHLYEPLKPEVKKQTDSIKLKKKEELAQAKVNYLKQKAYIEEKYNPKIKELKQKIKLAEKSAKAEKSSNAESLRTTSEVEKLRDSVPEKEDSQNLLELALKSTEEETT